MGKKERQLRNENRRLRRQIRDLGTSSPQAADDPPWSRRDIILAAVGAVAGTIQAGGVVHSLMVEHATAEREKQNRALRQLQSLLGSANWGVYLPDNHLNYPEENSFRRVDRRRDDRAEMFLQQFQTFSSEASLESDQRPRVETLDYNRMATRGYFRSGTAPGGLLVAGSSISNSLTEWLIGKARTGLPDFEFKSPDRQWSAKLKFVQFTPPNAVTKKARYANRDWVFYDHSIKTPGGREERGRFLGVGAEKQIECFFQIVRFQPTTQTNPILYIAGLHTLGTWASTQLFRAPFDLPTLSLIGQLHRRFASVPNWQALVHCSHFQNERATRLTLVTEMSGELNARSA